MIDTDTPEMHPARRRQLQRELEEARREWAEARAEDARLRDALELAEQAEGEAQAAHEDARRDALTAAWETGTMSPTSPAQARLARTEDALTAATRRRTQAAQRLRPSPLSDDVRLGVVVPVARRLSHGEQRVRALAAALGEAVPELADLPPEPPPGSPGDVERTMAWRAELVTLGVLGPDAPAARPLPTPPDLPSAPPPAPAPVTLRSEGDPPMPQVPPTRQTPEAPPAVAPEVPATGDPDLPALRARLAAARERWGAGG